MNDELYLELIHKETWDHERLVEDQVARVSRLVDFASKEVPHYREAFGGVDQISSISDLAELPILSRDVIRDDGVRLVADGVKRSSLGTATTGGTTGVPLRLYRDPGFSERERAHLFAAWRRFDLGPGERVAVVVARPISPDGDTQRLAEATQTLWLGGDHLSPDLLSEHAARILQFRPSLVRGYPSTLSTLARHIAENQLPVPDSIIVIGTSSEVLYPWQAEAITQTFRVPIANLYGQTEQVALAVSCLASPSLHVDTTYGVVEIVDGEGRPVRQPGGVGEIIATGLGNFKAPLIRYATGDRAAWETGDCDCGLRSPRMSKIDGRTADIVLDASGRPHLFGTRFFGPMFQPDTPIAKVQYRQEEPGVLLVTVRPRQGNDPGYVETWVRDALSSLEGFTVVVSTADVFRSTKSGKQPLFAPPRT